MVSAPIYILIYQSVFIWSIKVTIRAKIKIRSVEQVTQGRRNNKPSNYYAGFLLYYCTVPQVSYEDKNVSQPIEKAKASLLQSPTFHLFPRKQK